MSKVRLSEKSKAALRQLDGVTARGVAALRRGGVDILSAAHAGVVARLGALDGASGWTPTEADWLILKYLASQKVRRGVVDIAAGVDCDRGTVGARLKVLMENRLVELPEGTRSGYQLSAHAQAVMDDPR